MHPPLRSGRRLSADQRRRQILESARELVHTDGLEKLSVETAARSAGVSPGLLFHYFGSQRGFRAAVVQLVADELLGQVAPDPALSGAEQLRGGIERFVSFVGRHPSLYLAVVRQVDRGGTGAMATLHRDLRARFAEWILAALVEAGTPRTPAVGASVHGWLAYMEELLVGWLDGAELTAEQLTDLCERGAYQLVAVAVDDPERWRAVRAALDRRP
ncbi:TetR/AcrR family transcriptional regulator [Kitasatospora sp. NPDC096147]|uniref:TetR/AcrR family transcriptional regulator n=1 Tax=Kitasatospora sp. NPDC096147 TaxID=3364093 RepID=UPI0037FD8497